MKRMIWFTLALCSILAVFFNTAHVLAETMHSEQYEIDAPNVNIGSGTTSSDSYNIASTVGQTAAGEFASDGYVVKAGFQYIHSIIPFTFTLSDTSINFGTLTPQKFVEKPIQMTVSFGSAGGYEVTSQERNPLTSSGGNATIPDTKCDDSFGTCTITSAKPWTSTRTYGFGYSMSGTDIPADFIDETYFRPFSDGSKGDPPMIAMSDDDVTQDANATPKNTRTSTMTFKLNVAPAQQAGTYQTIIDFVAMPSY